MRSVKPAYGFYFKVEATRERFMESELVDISEHYIIADDYDEALDYIYEIMKHGGWKINKFIKHKAITLFDIKGGHE